MIRIKYPISAVSKMAVPEHEVDLALLTRDLIKQATPSNLANVIDFVYKMPFANQLMLMVCLLDKDSVGYENNEAFTQWCLTHYRRILTTQIGIRNNAHTDKKHNDKR